MLLSTLNPDEVITFSKTMSREQYSLLGIPPVPEERFIVSEKKALIKKLEEDGWKVKENTFDVKRIQNSGDKARYLIQIKATLR